MNFIIVHKDSFCKINNDSLLHFAISNEPIASLVLEGLYGILPQIGIQRFGWSHKGKVICYIPKEWKIDPCLRRGTPEIIFYKENLPVYSYILKRAKSKPWSVFVNGRFAAQIKTELLNKVLAAAKTDVLAVNVEPELIAYLEKVRLTADSKVAGFQRCYSDCAEPIPIPSDWPHYLIINNGVLGRILVDYALPDSFSAFVHKCQSATLTMYAVKAAGAAFDLETETGLLYFCRNQLSKIRSTLNGGISRNPNFISPDSKLVGKVLLGKNVHIGPKAIVIGPAIIGNNVNIEQGAIINSSIIGPDVCVLQNQVVQNRVMRKIKSQNSNIKNLDFYSLNFDFQQRTDKTFRSWPWLSYAGSFKRIADCLAAIIVLILFAPVIPFIALAVKLNSPGPVFFKDKRQGLHGKEFYCLKFRSMTVGADKIQDNLRAVSEVDGPQFKIVDDPRISTVGRFLRETYLDEIPQFFNVLLGQMSVIGPRPSPESENTLCPYWRDARLSVRPGISGLWQMCRTRNPMKDFQEWIHYDTEYIKNLSLRMDLWICWQTTKKLIKDFVRQF